MSANQINLEAEYKSLKTEYDSLLEKNQNDLIKIKQKEKQLNVSPLLILGGNTQIKRRKSKQRIRNERKIKGLTGINRKRAK